MQACRWRRWIRRSWGPRPRRSSRLARPRALLLGGHGVPADRDRVDPAVRAHQRSLRPQDRGLPDREIVIFLIASVLAGLSQNMGRFIAPRLAGLALVDCCPSRWRSAADVVAPRERGRYVGYFGAVWGFASVVGPLLGGFFVDNLSRRWIFTSICRSARSPGSRPAPSSTCHSRSGIRRSIMSVPRCSSERCQLRPGPVLDRRGVRMADASQCRWPASVLLLLPSSAGGESRVRDPILLLGDCFVAAHSASATRCCSSAARSRRRHLPADLSADRRRCLTDRIRAAPAPHRRVDHRLHRQRSTGQRYGRYKAFPILGTAVASTAIYLLSRWIRRRRRWMASVFMALLGIGLGLVMQVLIVAVQEQRR